MLDLKFDSDGLIPAICQDVTSGRVLMMAWMNAEALRLTRERGEATFWSRSRQTLWRKGESSGNVLKVVEIRADCDADALLLRVEAAGPACHTGVESCFFQDLDGARHEPPASGFLVALDALVAARRSADPATSYTARLLAGGPLTVAQTVGEEGVEVALAAVAQDDTRVIDEAADLLYHLIMLLRARGLSLLDVLKRLRQRHEA